MPRDSREYSREHFVAADWIDGLAVRIAVRQRVQDGKLTRLCVGFQVLRGERWTEIVRYDNSHGGFHRHVPGIPPDPRRREPVAVARGQEVKYALNDLQNNGTQYLREAAEDFEILDDFDDESTHDP